MLEAALQFYQLSAPLGILGNTILETIPTSGAYRFKMTRKYIQNP